MRILPKIRRLQLWIACLAILLNALAPSISHALASSQGRAAAWMEICSVDGTHLVADDATAPDQSPAQPAAQASQHCPFCATHAGDFALPPPAASALAPKRAAALQPFLFHHAPRPLFAWSAASPRAPPAAL